MFPLRFRLRTLMLLVIPAVGIGAWSYRVLPKCPVDGSVMRQGNVPINYGLVMFSASGLQYNKARASLFPNCDDAVLGGCVVGSAQTKQKNICRTCNATRDAWRLSQTKPTPTGPALSSDSNSGGSATSDSD
jgi:hypothetical protein